jgi:DNA-binding MarR family transcriptional regulator
MSLKTANLASPAACLCFNLRRAARLIARDLDGALKPAGLSSAQFAVLAVLEEAGPLPIAQLAEALGTDRTTLTRNLALLERDGLIAYRQGRDKRRRIAALNAEGEKAYRRALPLWRAFQEKKVAGLGPEPAQQLLSLLSQAAG